MKEFEDERPKELSNDAEKDNYIELLRTNSKDLRESVIEKFDTMEGMAMKLVELAPTVEDDQAEDAPAADA